MGSGPVLWVLESQRGAEWGLSVEASHLECARAHGRFTHGLACFVTFHRRRLTVVSDLGGDGLAMVSVLSMVKPEEVLWAHAREGPFFSWWTVHCFTISRGVLSSRASAVCCS